MAADEGKVLRTVLTELAKEGNRYVPVGISARHVHLCRNDLEILFGKGYELRHFKDLSQPGQFASQERVTLTGPKGKIENVRILGPVRSKTQVEISLSDAMQLGIKDLPVRLSGDLDNTPGIKITGPEGELTVPAGTIAAARHVHMSASQALAYGLHDRQVISLRFQGPRACVLENVVVRCGEGHELELHVDTDEANACALKNGDILEVIIPGEGRSDDDAGKPDMRRISDRAAAVLSGMCEAGCDTADSAAYEILDLVTEADINEAYGKGQTCVYCDRKALITPAAYDRSAQLGVAVVKADAVSKGPGLGCPASEEVLELVTAQDLNMAFKDDKKELYCSADALITPAAKERIEETGIRIIRV